MAKINYHFDPETLSFIMVKKGFKYFFSKTMSHVFSSLVFGTVVALFIFSFIDSPKEKQLNNEISRLVFQLNLMNKQMDEVNEVLVDLQKRDNNIYRVVFEADPIPSSVRNAGFGGSSRYDHLSDMVNGEMVTETRRKLDILTKKLYVQSKSFDEVINLSKNKEKMLASIPAIMPIANKDLKFTSSGYGWRIHPIYKIRLFHSGMDFSAPIGMPVVATGDGVVAEAGRASGYGNVVKLDHGFGYMTAYGHLRNFVVSPGQKIKRGTLLGYVGSTGVTSGPHLHYEVIKNSSPVDPVNFFFNDLSPEQYEKMVEISSNMGLNFD